MRLDMFLKISRLIKRRSLAKEVCDKQLVRVNGQPAKAGKLIQAGDLIVIAIKNRTLTVRVEQVPTGVVPKKDAPTMFTIIEDQRSQEDEDQW